MAKQSGESAVCIFPDCGKLATGRVSKYPCCEEHKKYQHRLGPALSRNSDPEWRKKWLTGFLEKQSGKTDRRYAVRGHLSEETKEKISKSRTKAVAVKCMIPGCNTTVNRVPSRTGKYGNFCSDHKGIGGQISLRMRGMNDAQRIEFLELLSKHTSKEARDIVMKK